MRNLPRVSFVVTILLLAVGATVTTAQTYNYVKSFEGNADGWTLTNMFHADPMIYNIEGEATASATTEISHAGGTFDIAVRARTGVVGSYSFNWGVTDGVNDYCVTDGVLAAEAAFWEVLTSSCTVPAGTYDFSIYIYEGSVQIQQVSLTGYSTVPTPTPTATATATPTMTPIPPTPGVGTVVAPTLTPEAGLLPPPIPTYQPPELQPVTPMPGITFNTEPVAFPDEADTPFDFTGWGVPALPEAIPLSDPEFRIEFDGLFDYDNIVLVFQIVRTYPSLVARLPGWFYVMFAVVIILSLRFFIGVATQRRQAADAANREVAREEAQYAKREEDREWNN